MKIFIKILKIILGIVLGLVFSFLTVLGLDIILPNLNHFGGPNVNLWWLAVIIAAWTFFFLWLMMRWKTSIKGIQTEGIKDLPLPISEFIDGVINAMKYRRNVRADVRQELTDHFTDALADYETEEEKQIVTKELIEEFGNVELLGKLLRRAKKRCRPLWRTMVARFFQLIGLSFLFLILYIGWFFVGKPVVTTNYVEVINQLVRPVANDSQNAWPFYQHAAEKYAIYETEDADHRDERIDIHPRTPSTLSEQNRQILLQWIKDNEKTVNLIRQGNQKSHCWRQYGRLDEKTPEQLIAIHIPHLSEFKKLTQLMCWKGLFNAEKGDFEKAFDDLLEVYFFGCHLRGQNTSFIEQLVAMSIESISRESLLMILTEYGEQIDVQALDSVRQRFAAIIEDKDFTIDYEFEKMFMYDEAQRCFTQSRFGKSHLYLPRLKQFGAFEMIELLELGNEDGVAGWIEGGLHILFTHPDKDQTLKEVERFYDEMEKLAAMTPASVKAQDLNTDEILLEVMKENVFLSVLMPALAKVNQYAYRGRTQAHATLVILGVMQYAKEHGQLPQSLDVLVDEGLLKEVPIDPFSDKPLVYRKTDDGFILYGVGQNFTDDGGVPGTDPNGKSRNWGENGDKIFWPMDLQ